MSNPVREEVRKLLQTVYKSEQYCSQITDDIEDIMTSPINAEFVRLMQKMASECMMNEPDSPNPSGVTTVKDIERRELVEELYKEIYKANGSTLNCNIREAITLVLRKRGF